MHDAGAVSLVECRRDLDREPKRVRHRQRTLDESRLQRLAFKQFHHQEVDAILLPDVVERADVRMAQRSDGARFVLEAFARSRIVRDVRRQDLDRDRAAEPRVARLVHFAHPAGAKGRHDFVGAEPAAGGENRRLRCLHHRRWWADERIGEESFTGDGQPIEDASARGVRHQKRLDFATQFIIVARRIDHERVALFGRQLYCGLKERLGALPTLVGH